MGSVKNGGNSALNAEAARVSPPRLLLAAIIALAGCAPSPAPPGADSAIENPSPLDVHVTSYPLQYFAERIGGDRVRVRFPAPPDEDPAFWMPDAGTVAAYQDADLVLLNGAGYEQWINRVALPSSICRDTSAAFRDQLIREGDTVTHSHGPEGEHAHGGTAFTTWLDPRLAIRQAESVRDAFTAQRPPYAEEFSQRFAALRSDLEAIDARLAATAERVRQTPLLFSHPVYQYLQRRYGLNGRSVHWEPHEPPTEALWRELEQLLAEHPAKWMIWEGPPAAETMARLEQIGIRSVVFQPCGNRPAAGDYLDAMRRNADELERVAAP